MEVEGLGRRESTDDERSKGKVVDELVALVVEDAVQGEDEDEGASDVTTASAEGVANSKHGPSDKRDNHQDLDNQRRVTSVASMGECGKARDERHHDRERVPEREWQVNENERKDVTGRVRGERVVAVSRTLGQPLAPARLKR